MLGLALDVRLDLALVSHLVLDSSVQNDSSILLVLLCVRKDQ